jgi:hypothetical protein
VEFLERAKILDEPSSRGLRNESNVVWSCRTNVTQIVSRKLETL